MSGGSSSGAAWSTRLELLRRPEDLFQRGDDPRLGEVVEYWRGDPAALKPGRGVLVGFPQDEGVRRNQGRPGAAEAPAHIRHWLYRLTPWDSTYDVDLTQSPPLDLGNVRIECDLEETQQALGEVIGAILATGAIPIVLGGGHETAYGHYLGYVVAQRRVGIINIDAHLDVRPYPGGHGHSGSPFRQAMEHPTHPLAGPHYVCLGAQPHCVSRQHWEYASERGCVVHWAYELEFNLAQHCYHERDRLKAEDCQVYLSLDADAVAAHSVPGVSAPNAAGLASEDVMCCVRAAARSPEVSSFDLVEINPRHDRDGQSARWAALVVWNFLIGLAVRR
jgi:formiminoglutamase